MTDEHEEQAEKTRTDYLIIAPQKRIERMLLKLLAYMSEDQKELLPALWEIEHIFPQTWDTKYYNYDKEKIAESLEHIGNKLPLEKKLNISASNNYFDKKKEKYRASQIAISAKIGNSSLIEWNLDNIADEDIKIAAQVKQLFKTWVTDYESAPILKGKSQPTPEEQAQIERFRKLGYI